MTASPGAARVLVASDSASDASQIVRLLEDHFSQVSMSTVQEQAVKDFETHKPEVLVLAFDQINKAQSYYLGLYRFGQSLQQHPHRTVLLCNKDEVLEAFELCKKQYFDDYVLYWPFAHDGLRLPMSIWIAAREMMAMNAQAPPHSELLSHAQNLGDLEGMLGRELPAGEEKVTAAQNSLSQLERELASAADEFSHRLVGGDATAAIAVKNSNALAHEIERLKAQQLAQTRAAGANGIEPLTSWAHQFKEQVEPALAGTRALSKLVRGIRRLLMVIDDDEMTRDLIVRALKDTAYDVLPVGDGTEALRELRRARPDVIFMDIRLPGLDGVSLTRRLKASPHLAKIPVIMMTGDSRRETVTRSIEAGAADFVAKPFTREALLAKLQKIMPASV